MPKNIYLTPSFLETQRSKGIMNTVLADFIGKNVPEVSSEVQMVRQKYGKDNDAAVKNYLDWKIYGTAQPMNRYTPEVSQPEQPSGPDFTGQVGEESLKGLGELRSGKTEPSTFGKIGMELMPAGATRTGPNLFERIGEDVENRGVKLREGLQRDDGALSKVRGAFTQFTGGIKDVGGEVLKTASGVLPKFIESGFSMIAQDLGAPEAAQEMSQKYASWKEQHPEAAANLEAIGNLGGAAMATYGVQGLAQQATGSVQKAVQGGKEFMKSEPPAITSQPTKGIEKFAQPKATREEIFQAERQGRATFNRKGEPVGITPTDRQTEIAQSMQEAGVRQGMKHGDVTRTVQKGIETSGKQVEAEIAQSNLAFNDNEVRGIYQSAQRSAMDDAVAITSQEQKTFRSVADAYMKKFQSVLKVPQDEFIPGTKFKGAGGNRLLALYRTRQVMDTLAPAKTFTGDSVMNAKVNAFRYYRDASNDFITTAMEANGMQYAQPNRHMSNLFRALDALETTAPKSLSPTTYQKALGVLKKTAGYGALGYVGIEGTKRLLSTD